MTLVWFSWLQDLRNLTPQCNIFHGALGHEIFHNSFNGSLFLYFSVNNGWRFSSSWAISPWLLTLWTLVLITVSSAYGSDSFPSTLTVEPTLAWLIIKSESSVRFSSSASAENSCPNNLFTAWKSTGSKSKKSKSTSTISCKVEVCQWESSCHFGSFRLSVALTSSSSCESSDLSSMGSSLGSSAFRLLIRSWCASAT